VHFRVPKDKTSDILIMTGYFCNKKARLEAKKRKYLKVYKNKMRNTLSPGHFIY